MSMLSWMNWIYIPPYVLLIECLYFGITFLLFYIPKTSKPKLYNADTPFNAAIRNRLQTLKSVFCPPFLLSNRHVQTVIGSIGNMDDLQFERKYIDVADNGVIAIDILVNNKSIISTRSRIVILLPGITGSKSCLKSMCMIVRKKDVRIIVFNKRGHDKSNLLTPFLQLFGDARDFRQCVEYLKQTYPEANMAAVGYSGGAGLLQSYLISYSGKTLFSSVVFISSGFNVAHLSMINISRIYERLMVHQLKDCIVRPNESVLEKVVDLHAVYRSTSLRVFDHHLYCKMHGFRDVVAMWSDGNPMNNVHNVEVPVLCVSSMDDPVCLSENIPYELFDKHNWMLMTTEIGGHCGFHEGWGLESYADKVALEYIEAVLDTKESLQVSPIIANGNALQISPIIVNGNAPLA